VNHDVAEKYYSPPLIKHKKTHTAPIEVMCVFRLIIKLKQFHYIITKSVIIVKKIIILS